MSYAGDDANFSPRATKDALSHLLAANGYSDEDLSKPERIKSLEMVLDDFCCMKSLETFPKLQSVCLIQQDIRKIEGLDRCTELERLLLNENSIERIEGLHNCRKLQKLYLAFNNIKDIGQGLVGLTQLQVLWLAANRLTSLEGLDAPNLTELNAAGNRISSIEHVVDRMPKLQSLNLSDNRLCSYREVISLSRLSSLRTLSFADPDFGENPICFLCNYQTYVLYHLPKLQVHDQMHVTPEAHASAMNAFVKKRLFYNMRIKTLQRQAADCVRAAKVIDEERRNVLARDLEAAARTLRRAWAFQHARAEGHESAEADPSEYQDLEAVEERLQLCQVEIEDADAALEELKREVAAERASQIRSLVLELHSGGNVRLEQGADTTPWVAQIRDLVMSRFRHEDFEDLGITGFKVTGASRIHHRSLRLEFDQILSRVDPDGDRNFEHLFYIPDPNRQAAEEIWELAEVGLASRFASELQAAALPSEFLEASPRRSESGEMGSEEAEHRSPVRDESRMSQQWASPPTSPAAVASSRRVLLTNSVALAEVGRLQSFAATALGKATQRAVARAQKPRGAVTAAAEDAGFLVPARCGVMLICQVHLGEQVHDNPGSFDPSALDVHEQWKQRPSENCSPGVVPVFVDNPRPLRAFYRSRQDDDKIKVWHVPHVELILPEFIVEFEYTHSFEAVRKDSLKAWLEFGPFARLLSKYAFFAQMGVEDHSSRRKNKPTPGQDVAHQLISQEDADHDGVPSHWPLSLPDLPAVPRLTNSALLNPSLHITTSNFANLKVLNLHGRGLRRIEANALDGLSSLRTMLLSFNCIESFGAIPPCDSVTALDMAHNLIQKVSAVVGFPALTDLDLSWNQLLSVETLGILARDVPRLESLVILGNPLTREESSWRSVALAKLVYLRTLDHKEVKPEEAREATHRSRGHQGRLSEDVLRQHAFAPPKRGSHDERRPPLPGELCYDPSADRVSTLLASSTARSDGHQISDVNWRKQVAAVDLKGLGLTDLRGLSGLESCQTLCLDDNEIGTLEWLPSLPQLEELSIERCGLLSLQGLSTCQELQKLDAGGNHLTDALELQKLDKLSQLSLEDNFVDSLDTFAQLRSLMELYLSNNVIEELRSVLLLKQLPKLTILDLSGNDLCKAPDYRQYTIFHLRKLKVLDGKPILHAELHKADEKFSGKVTMELLEEKLGPSASCYSFRTVDLSSQGIREMGQLINDDLFPSLRELILDGNPFTDIRNLGPLSKLLVLRMNKTKLDLESGVMGGADETHGGMGTFPNLQVWEVGFSGITDLRFFSQLPLQMLRILHLPGNEITKLEGLNHMEQLRELILDKNKIKQFDEKSFEGLKALRELRVEENGLKSLQNLGPLPRLRALYLSLNRIAEFSELDRLRPLKRLLVIHMAQNPVARKPQYRAQLLSCVPTARAVDGKEVTAEERERIEQLIQLSDNGKVNAVYVFNEPPPPSVQVTYMSPPLATLPGPGAEAAPRSGPAVEPGRMDSNRRPSQAPVVEPDFGGGSSKKAAAEPRAASAPRRGADGKGSGK